METKRTPMSNFVHLRIIAKLFRFIELCLALTFLFWISNRVPFMFRISNGFFRQLIFVISKPPFVFVLFNVIAATVIALSSRLKEKNLSDDEHFENEVYEEIVKAGEPQTENVKPTLSLLNEEDDDEENVFHGKQVVSEVHSASESESDMDWESEYPKVYRRTRPEKMERKRCVKDLRRVAAENCWSSVEQSPESLSPRDDLSSVEFQQTIDDFIAKQLRFRRQECLAVVNSEALVSVKSV